MDRKWLSVDIRIGRILAKLAQRDSHWRQPIVFLYHLRDEVFNQMSNVFRYEGVWVCGGFSLNHCSRISAKNGGRRPNRNGYWRPKERRDLTGALLNLGQGEHLCHYTSFLVLIAMVSKTLSTTVMGKIIKYYIFTHKKTIHGHIIISMNVLNKNLNPAITMSKQAAYALWLAKELRYRL